MYGLTHLLFHNNKKVYTPMGGSPTITFMVYAFFGSSPKLKVITFTLVFIAYSNA